MRLSSLLILLAIVGSAVGVFGFNAFGLRDQFFSGVQKGKEFVQGYNAAKSPTEAMDMFRKAIQNRQYKTAAKFCTGDYAVQLTKAHDAAAALGEVIDQVQEYMKESGYSGPKAKTLLAKLDPFPTNFSVAAAPVEKKGKTWGLFKIDPIADVGANVVSELLRMDLGMFNNNLAPAATMFTGFEIVKESEGDAVEWKLFFPIPPIQVQAVSYYMDHYRAYDTGLTKFRREATNQRYGSKAEFERELIKVLEEAK
ncbi:MAG: hypothetical protein L0Y72_06215 [Gemmataceae bacterium]|nr:hypothetical protein [Gemmataceae bacterium]MCI0738621.1 hypothetical protein [Gemmataceae bacterium]